MQPSGEAVPKAEVRPIKDLRKRKQTPASDQTEPPMERRVAAKKAESGLLESDQDLISEYYSIVEITAISNLLLCSYDLIVFHIFAGSGDEYEPSKKEKKEYREEMEVVEDPSDLAAADLSEQDSPRDQAAPQTDCD